MVVYLSGQETALALDAILWLHMLDEKLLETVGESWRLYTDEPHHTGENWEWVGTFYSYRRAPLLWGSLKLVYTALFLLGCKRLSRPHPAPGPRIYQVCLRKVWRDVEVCVQTSSSSWMSRLLVVWLCVFVKGSSDSGHNCGNILRDSNRNSLVCSGCPLTSFFRLINPALISKGRLFVICFFESKWCLFYSLKLFRMNIK